MPRRAVVHAILAAVSLAAFLWLLIAVVSGNPSVLAFDWQVRSWIHQHAVCAVTAAMKLITVFGSVRWVLTCTALAFLMLRKDGQPRAALVLLIAIAGAYAIENALKFAVRRVRPGAFFDVIAPVTYSFPSGHALASTALYGTLGYIASRRAKSRYQRAMVWLSVALTVVLICLSRVYLGVHYPSDVIGGVLIGCFWVNAVLTFAKLP
jgi:undecaprenyl-diphosphatase